MLVLGVLVLVLGVLVLVLGGLAGGAFVLVLVGCSFVLVLVFVFVFVLVACAFASIRHASCPANSTRAALALAFPLRCQHRRLPCARYVPPRSRKVGSLGGVLPLISARNREP